MADGIKIRQKTRTQDDYTQIIRLLESARQIAEMNQLSMLIYLVEMAKTEARSHRLDLRNRKRGEPIEP